MVKTSVVPVCISTGQMNRIFNERNDDDFTDSKISISITEQESFTASRGAALSAFGAFTDHVNYGRASAFDCKVLVCRLCIYQELFISTACQIWRQRNSSTKKYKTTPKVLISKPMPAAFIAAPATEVRANRVFGALYTHDAVHV